MFGSFPYASFPYASTLSTGSKAFTVYGVDHGRKTTSSKPFYFGIKSGAGSTIMTARKKTTNKKFTFGIKDEQEG